MTTIERTQPDRAAPLKPGDLDWRPLDPGNPSGPQMAALWGDPTSGPYGALLRVPAGFQSPMHRHSSDERVVVITGASIHWVEGEDPDDAPTMRAGDYMLMPAGVNYVSAAAGDEECVEFITQDGRFDFTLASFPGGTASGTDGTASKNGAGPR